MSSARRAGQVAKEFQDQGFPPTQAVSDALQQEAMVLQRITDLAIAPPTAGYSPAVETQKVPTATDATAAMLRVALSDSRARRSTGHTRP